MPTATILSWVKAAVDRAGPSHTLTRVQMNVAALELSASSPTLTHPVGAGVGTISKTLKETT